MQDPRPLTALPGAGNYAETAREQAAPAIDRDRAERPEESSKAEPLQEAPGGPSFLLILLRALSAWGT